LVEVESAGSGGAADLRWFRLRQTGGVDGDDGVLRTLVIRQCVLRIAHNDVRFTVDQLSGEMYSAEFVRSILYTPKETKVSGVEERNPIRTTARTTGNAPERGPTLPPTPFVENDCMVCSRRGSVRLANSRRDRRTACQF